MGINLPAVKRRYNEKTYTKLIFAVPKEQAEAFKLKCKEKGVSQASIFEEAMEKFLEED